MSKHLTSEAELSTALAAYEQLGGRRLYRYIKITARQYEIWAGAGIDAYVCMLTKNERGWAATHNMTPDDRSTYFPAPLLAIADYMQIRK
jgi:hypothetical protein